MADVSVNFEDTWALLDELGRAKFLAAQNAALVTKLSARVSELEAQLSEFTDVADPEPAQAPG